MNKAAEAEQLRPGMPAADSVQEILHMTTPEGKKIEIQRTNETDAYDPPLKPQEGRASGRKRKG
jgi:hypothetical protein